MRRKVLLHMVGWCLSGTLALFLSPGVGGLSQYAFGGQPLPYQQPINLKFVAMNSSPFSSIQPRPKLPIEPEEFDPRELDAYYDWRNDMFFREFDLTGSGSVNFMTARRTYKVWLDEFGTPVVLTVGDPVFYWIDLNGNGKFEEDQGEMWKDAYEDGVTGNEEPYDNSDIQESPGPGPEWSPLPHGGFKQPPCDPRFGC
ncbi:MAG: hypothetical protein AB7T38_17895 [Nitrospirales bacterium]